MRKLLEIQDLNQETYKRERVLIENLLRTNVEKNEPDVIKVLNQLNVIFNNAEDSLKINREILFAMAIVSPEEPKNNTILATFKGGKISVGKFRDAIDKLPVQARQYLNELKNKHQFLKYVILSKFFPVSENIADLQINEDVLNKSENILSS